MPFTEDLTPFFAEFGEDGTLAGQPVRVIFDAPYELALVGEVGQASAAPQCRLPTAQVPAVVHLQALVLARGSFRVREHQPDGTGVSLLILEPAT